jgi:hypothetical protein
MLHNILVLVGVVIVAFMITLLFWNSGGTRRRSHGYFKGWWKAEGIMVWFFAVVALILIAAVRGWFQLTINSPGLVR